MKRKTRRKRPKPHRHPTLNRLLGAEMTCGVRRPDEWFDLGVIQDVARGYAAWCERQRKAAEAEGKVWIEQPVNRDQIEQPAEFFAYAEKHSDL